MNINSINEKPSFKGLLKVKHYEKIGEELIKIKSQVKTTKAEDFAIKKICQKPKSSTSVGGISQKNAEKLKELFETITGQKFNDESLGKAILKSNKKIIFTDLLPEEFGGTVYTLHLKG
jgi:hypothetical protein